MYRACFKNVPSSEASMEEERRAVTTAQAMWEQNTPEGEHRVTGGKEYRVTEEVASEG